MSFSSLCLSEHIFLCIKSKHDLVFDAFNQTACRHFSV